MSVVPGARVGSYEVLTPIGAGGKENGALTLVVNWMAGLKARK